MIVSSGLSGSLIYILLLAFIKPGIVSGVVPGQHEIF